MKVDWESDFSVRQIVERDPSDLNLVSTDLVPHILSQNLKLILDGGKSAIINMYLRLQTLKECDDVFSNRVEIF